MLQTASNLRAALLPRAKAAIVAPLQQTLAPQKRRQQWSPWSVSMPPSTTSSYGRTFRFFASVAGNDKEATAAFIVERGYNQEIAKGIVDALAQQNSGVPAGMMLTTITALAGRWEIGEDAGLESLAKSVEQELAKKRGEKMVHFIVKPPGGGASFEVEGLVGMSLKDVAEHGDSAGAKLLAEYLECACSGIMACSTCQVYVSPQWYDSVGSPSEHEEDMIELAHNPRETSRLGCQIKLTSAIDGFHIEVPGGANNMFDHIPFD